MTIYELTVVTERDEDGRYIAVCPALQGCYTEAEPKKRREHRSATPFGCISRIA